MSNAFSGASFSSLSPFGTGSVVPLDFAEKQVHAAIASLAWFIKMSYGTPGIDGGFLW